jgi:hypothetical protein
MSRSSGRSAHAVAVFNGRNMPRVRRESGLCVRAVRQADDKDWRNADDRLLRLRPRPAVGLFGASSCLRPRVRGLHAPVTASPDGRAEAQMLRVLGLPADSNLLLQRYAHDVRAHEAMRSGEW